MKSFGVGAAVFCLILTGCGPGRFSQQGQQGGAQAGAQTAGVLRYPIINKPTTLDPHKVQDGDTIDLLQQVYEGLVGWSPDNVPVGYLAAKWEVSPDQLTYTFTLKDAKFHNGRTVTADDVKWSLERSASPEIASPISDAYLSGIKGFSDRFRGKASEVSGVKVIDPKHVSITLNAPDRNFLGKLTYLSGAVLPKEAFPADHEVSDVKQMIGTGPFRFKTWLPDQLAVLERFDAYHDGAPKLQTIERPVLQDAVTRLNKFRQGEIDLLYVQRSDLAGLKKDAKLAGLIHYFQRPSIYYVGINQLMYPPFKDKRVRQAFAMAIDRAKIVQDVLAGEVPAANSIVPPGVPGGDRKGAKALPFDPAAAKRLLAEAGFHDPSKLPPLTLTCREDQPDVKMVAERVASDVTNNLGVNVSVQTMEWGAYLTKYNAKQQTFFHMRWAADYVDPENFLSHMLATWGPENKVGYSNPVFDRLCKEADAKPKVEDSLPLYAQAEDTVLQDAVWVPVYYQRDAELESARVSGLRESLFGHLPHTTTTVR